MIEFEMITISTNPLDPNFDDPFYKSTLYSPPVPSIPPAAFQFSQNDFISKLFPNITVEEFQTRHWEKEFYFGHINNVESVIPYTINSFENDIKNANLSLDTFSVSMNSRPIPVTEMASFKDSLNDFAETYYQRKDASIRIMGIDRLTQCEKLRQLCKELSKWSNTHCSSVAFYSSPYASALPVHWDTENLLVLQLDGEKVWEFSDSNFKLPTNIHPPGVFKSKHVKPIDGNRVTMKKGDLLYIPRGWLHKAQATSSHSLHITFGIVTMTWFEFIKFATQNALLKLSMDEGLRQSVNRYDDASEEYLKNKLNEITDLFKVSDTKTFFQLWNDTLPTELKEFQDYKTIMKFYEDFVNQNGELVRNLDTVITVKPIENQRSQIITSGLKLIGTDEEMGKLTTLLNQKVVSYQEIQALIPQNKHQYLITSIISSGLYKKG
jgi:ribosomal protein L16 Arg81 hydroxylase